MSPQPGAKFAAVVSARGRRRTFHLAIVVAVSIAVAGGASAATTRLTGADPADPADPAARTAAVGYRSTIAPYTPLRPATPTPWRERNERVAPKPSSEREPK